MKFDMWRMGPFIACGMLLVAGEAAAQSGLQSTDLLKWRWVSAGHVSPDGRGSPTP